MNNLLAADTVNQLHRATATEYLTVDLVQLFAALVIMFIFASAFLTTVKVLSTKKKTKIMPNSDKNQTVSVMVCVLPGWLWFSFEIFCIALSIAFIRGMFGAPIKFNMFTQEGATATVEIIICFGLLFATVPKWGLKALQALGDGIIKSRLSTGVGEVIVTPEQYMTLGSTTDVNPAPAADVTATLTTNQTKQ